jgi:putative ABC transport system permease protein
MDLHPRTPIRANGTVLVFTLGLAVVSGLLFGMVPALQAARPDLAGALKEGSQRTTGGVRGVRIRRALVVAEVALALMPIILAIELVKTFTALVGTDPGFVADHLLTMKLSLPPARYGNPAAFVNFDRQVRERAGAVPGVRLAVFSMSLPMEQGPALPFTIEGKYQGKGSEEGVGRAQYRAVDPGFFTALGVPLLRGRTFTERDGQHGELLAVINETMARHYWPGQDPIGRRITIGQPALPELADPTPRTIVGLVKDVRERGVQTAAPEIVYVPLAQVPPPFQAGFVKVMPMSLLARTAGDAGGVAAALTRVVWAVDPDVPVHGIAPMREVVARSLGAERFAALLLGLLATAALTLAALGIYGVLSYLVGRQQREIGVRMALGATSSRVLWTVLEQGAGPVLVGVALGVAGAVALTRALGHLLTGVSLDPITFLLGPLLLIAVALLACSLPARRASRVDPVVSLREG